MTVEIKKQKNAIKAFSPRNITWMKSTILALAVSLIFTVIFYSPVGEVLNVYGVKKLEFFVREFLGKDPELHPQIKVFTLDDKAAADVKGFDLTFEQWAVLIEGIAKRKPKTIIIDKAFGFYKGEKEAAKRFTKKIKNLGIPVSVGGFATNRAIGDRDPLVEKRDDFSIEKLFEANPKYIDLLGKEEAIPKELVDEIDWMPRKWDYFYGPAPELLGSFTHVGHFINRGDGYIDPFLRARQNWAMPHLSFFSSESIYIGKDGFYLNGHKVYLDQKGRVPVNFVSHRKLYERPWGLRGSLRKAEDGITIDKIESQDIVLILPGMATGSSDIKISPVGKLPGGFLHLSLINSVVSKNWLRPLDSLTVPLIILSSLLGMICGMWLWTSGILVFIFSVPILFFMIGMGSFCYFDYIFPWMLPGSSMLLSAILVFVERFKVAEKQTVLLEGALSKAIPDKCLDEIIKAPWKLQNEAVEKTVTIMFIDIVGFSLAAERQTPGEIFSELKEVFTWLKHVIHEHGGTVDKLLGDGLLCFFGYNYQKDLKGSLIRCSDVDQAFNCAIEIQRQAVKRCITAKDEGKPVYPLRIGMNTATVHIGDLGGDRAMDFTIIGHGVNIAKRLEAACGLFKIMVSCTTRDLLGSISSTSNNLQVRYLKLKHHEQSVRAWEYDPFIENPEEFSTAQIAYKEFAGFERGETRWPVPSDRTLLVETIDSNINSKGRLHNFSLNGLSVELDQFYAKGVELKILLKTSPHETSFDLQIVLKEERLSPIIGEVRWGRLYGDKFLHGILIKNLNLEQKACLLSYLRQKIVVDLQQTGISKENDVS